MQHDIEIPQWDHLPQLSWKEKVAYLTFQFLKLPQAECPVKHLFTQGSYLREMFIPAGSFFLGRTHRYGHECRLLSGSVVHITPEGRQRIDAPFSTHTTPGYNMILYALTDVVGLTVHPNPMGLKDVQKLEDDIFEPVEDLAALGREVAEKLEAPCLA